MGPFVEGYRMRLLELGYTPSTARQQLQVLGQLGRWIESAGVQAGQLDDGLVEAFLVSRRADGHGRVPTVRTLRSLLECLRDVGVIVVEDGGQPLTPLDELVGRYREWLVVERALAPATVVRYERLARRFLAERTAPAGEPAVESLTGADVAGFLLRECARVSVGSAKGRVAELRSLLRFLYLRGLMPLALADALPPVAGWREAVFRRR
jgi:hypothetical protein